MSEVVGVVVAIGVAVIALVSILTYMQVSRFLEAYRVHMQRLGDKTCDVGDRISSTLGNIDGLVDEVKTTVIEVREKAASIEREISPLAQNIDKSLTDANPLIKSLSEGSDDIRAAFESLHIVTSGVAEVTNGLREVIVPTINNVRSILQGLSEGARMLGLGVEKEEE
jgi:methyl-accepting chemotaxis protein